MKKNIIINMFLLFFLPSMAVYAGRPIGEIAIFNKTNKEITVRVKVYEKFLFRRKDDTYEYRSLPHLNDLDLDCYIRITDLNPVVLKPSEKGSFFFYRLYTKGGENFEEKDVAEQFKTIYQYFSVTDEDGNELLNIDTIKSSDFIEEGTFMWVLVIE
jgi:hypothetical protein